MDNTKYKIKVNKKSFTNSQHNIKLYIKKFNRNEDITPINTRQNFSTSKTRKNLSATKTYNVSNSTQRITKKTSKIKISENNEDNVIESLENNKFSKPLLNSENINKKLNGYGIKESVKTNLKILLQGNFMQDKKLLMNFKFEPFNINYNNQNQNISNEKDSINNNYKTIENSDNNNFYNNFTINSPKFNVNYSVEKKKLDFNRKKNKNKIHSSEMVLHSNYDRRTHNNTMIENDLYNKFDISFKKKPKYDFNKEKFYIYREKLIRAFFGHIENILNKYKEKYFLFFKEQTKKKKIIQKLKPLNKTSIKYQNIQTYYNNVNNLNVLYKHKGNLIRSFWAANNDNSKTKLQKYIHRNTNFSNRGTNINIIDSDKNFFSHKKTNVSFSNDLKSFHNNINKNIYNSSFLLYNSRNSSYNSNKKLQPTKKTLDKSILRNLKSSINKVNESSKFVYKKKLNLNNKSKILNKNSPENKIIDIKIDIGKPIGVIRDLNPLDCHYLSQNYITKRSKICLSSNKKKKKRTPTKRIVLPNKKFLEEEENFDIKFFSSFHSMKTFNPSLKTSTNNTHNMNKENFNINKIKNQNSKDNKIRCALVKNIATSDKLLFIHIKYIYSNFVDKNRKKKFDQKTLAISNNFISIIKKKIVEKKHKVLEYMNNSILYKKISRNNIITIGKLNENKIKNCFTTTNCSDTNNKYLNSCLKFLIKIINKLFLYKNYKIFKRNIYQRYIPKTDVRRKYLK